MEAVVEEKYGQVLTGVAGAIAAALLSNETSWRRLSVIGITGSFFAVFVVPYICERFGVTSPTAISASGFLGGMLGCTILTAILKWAQTHNWMEMLSSRFGKKE